MTKRAGKRKHRMGSQRHPPGKINGPDTIDGPDNLNPAESLRLEIKALSEGWLVGAKHAEKRQRLVERLLDKGLDENAPAEQIARIINTINRAEVQTVRTLLAAEKAAKDAQPIVIVQQNNNQVDTLASLIDQMDDAEAEEFLQKHGRKLGRSAVLQAISTGVSSEPALAVGSQESV